MISLAQQECEHYERCRVHAVAGLSPLACACRTCPNPPRTLAKVHEPAADLGAGWALQCAGAPVMACADSEGGHAD